MRVKVKIRVKATIRVSSVSNPPTCVSNLVQPLAAAISAPMGQSRGYNVEIKSQRNSVNESVAGLDMREHFSGKKVDEARGQH